MIPFLFFVLLFFLTEFIFEETTDAQMVLDISLRGPLSGSHPCYGYCRNFFSGTYLIFLISPFLNCHLLKISLTSISIKKISSTYSDVSLFEEYFKELS